MKVWMSAEAFLRRLSQRDTKAWGPEQDSALALMRHDYERGGGLTGDTTKLRQIRASLIWVGQKALDWERIHDRRRR